MHTLNIAIGSNQDFDVRSPIGDFPAAGPDLEHTIIADSAEELTARAMVFLALLEIRQPGDSSYGEGRMSGYDAEFKMNIYEALRSLAAHQLTYNGGKRRTLDMSYTASEKLQPKAKKGAPSPAIPAAEKGEKQP